jgi:hypothetical protein
MRIKSHLNFVNLATKQGVRISHKNIWSKHSNVFSNTAGTTNRTNLNVLSA